jgi:hypothetical protein
MENTQAMTRHSLGAVLTLTTDRVLAPWSDVHALVEHLAGEPVWTHQIPRVATEAVPHILAQYPKLAEVQVPDGIDSWAGCVTFLATLTPTFGETLDIAPMPTVDHTSIDPLAEMAMNHPHIEVVPFDAGSQR